MVLIRAILDQATYFPGDVVRCKLLVSHSPTPPTPHTHPSTPTFPSLSALSPFSLFSFSSGSLSTQQLTSSGDSYEEKETLNWATVQVVGSCVVDATYTLLTPETSTSHENTASGDLHASYLQRGDTITRVGTPQVYRSSPSKGPHTALPDLSETGNNRACIFATRPTIVLCDLSLKSGTVRAFYYHARLPPSLPPSFRGASVKYHYSVVIGAQKTQQQAVMLQLPFRVLMPSCLPPRADEAPPLVAYPPGYPDFDYDVLSKEVADVSMEGNWVVHEGQTLGKRASRLPFFNDNVDEGGSESVQAPKADPVVFNIRSGGDLVARLSLPKLSYQLGDLVQGIFDFSCGVVACFKVFVALVTEESVMMHPELSEETPLDGHRREWGQHHELTLHSMGTSFLISIPADATPAFCTDLVSLQWSLQCEFVVSGTPSTTPAEDRDDGVASFLHPGRVLRTPVYTLPSPPTPCQYLRWHIPIHVSAKSGPARTGAVFPARLEKTM